MLACHHLMLLISDVEAGRGAKFDRPADCGFRVTSWH
jgi:hypothetical protein